METVKGLPLIGQHPAIVEALHLGRRVARCALPVNIFGETGTGKELFARFIHSESPHRDGPFVAVDCGILSREMARSELFGYVRGAFTGALETRPGLVEAACGGTLFLDEIGELDADLQLQLLRLIQEGEFRRVGETGYRKANVRLITATHRDLSALMQARAFREDLYYRLTVIPIALPPLRARRSDIPLLIQHFCRIYARPVGRRSFSPEAIEMMTRYPWPGNVRQLAHEVARLLVVSEGTCIEAAHLPAYMCEAPGEADEFDLPFKDARQINQQKFMREYLHRALVRSGGNVSLAAKTSGVGRQYFQLRMSEHGIRSEAYRQRAAKGEKN